MLSDSKPYSYVNDHFPRIGAAAKLYWGEPEFVPYVENLLLDTRNQTRKGFPADMVAALHSLLAHHHVEFPDLAPPGESVWVANNKAR